MTLRDRRRRKRGVQSPVDQEMKAHLADAKRALDRAKAVCARVAHSSDPELQAASVQARRNRALLDSLLTQLTKVGSFQSSLAADVDTLSEETLGVLSRERSLKRRAAEMSKRRVQATQAAVHNVLSSLAVISEKE